MLAEVRLGVQGMTELIESLLIFSRTGRSMQLTYESLPIIVERAASLLRTHPDAQKVAIELDALPSADCWIDAKKMERAIYNLLLNACHAAKFGSSSPRVVVQMQNTEEWIILHVEDNGAGVSATVRATMFQPFVSEGKQGGSGLGLTLASRIAQEHGGSVELDESQPGRTIFLMSIAKSKLQAMRVAESTTVTTHAAVATLPEGSSEPALPAGASCPHAACPGINHGRPAPAVTFERGGRYATASGAVAEADRPA